VNVENGIQLRELQQIGNLTTGMGELKLAPGSALRAVALTTRLPTAVIVFKQSGAA